MAEQVHPALGEVARDLEDDPGEEGPDDGEDGASRSADPLQPLGCRRPVAAAGSNVPSVWGSLPACNRSKCG